MSHPMGRGVRAVLAALFAIGLVRIAAIFIGWSAYAGDYADYTRIMAAVPEGALVIDILPTGEDKRDGLTRSEEHTSELQSLMRISYAVFCLKKKNKKCTNPILSFKTLH